MLRSLPVDPKLYRIYALIDPNTRAAHYVGQTANLLGYRLRDHLKPARTKKGQWVRALLEAGQEPQIVLLEEFVGFRRRAYERETHWIRRLRAEGQPLLNGVV